MTPEAAPRTAEFDERIREALWRLHGHDFIYGDDGEMQCNWTEHPTDFKRATMGRLLEHCDLARLWRAEAAAGTALDVDLMREIVQNGVPPDALMVTDQPTMQIGMGGKGLYDWWHLRWAPTLAKVRARLAGVEK